ncbi:MAG: DUF3604 domain-containing protein [Myxococcota bacterium]
MPSARPLLLAPLFALSFAALAFSARATDDPAVDARAPGSTSTGAPAYSPALADDFPTQVFWGDTHVHTAFSMDANAMGNARLSPADAYRFARGEPVRASLGLVARLEVPLDFLVVADHAEYLGLLPRLRDGDPLVLADPAGQRLYESLQRDGAHGRETLRALSRSKRERKPLIDDPRIAQSLWAETTALADRYDEPGRFTALIGFEWTSMPRGDNLHRVVVYRDGADRAQQRVPISSFDSERPEDLWTYLEDYERRTGGRIFAIPHNPNASNGLMFALRDSEGVPFDRAYAERRLRHEPLVEVTQIKGDSETHPLLSPDDAFADFETWDFGNLATPPLPKTPDMLPSEYVRAALKRGLAEQTRLGVNPFKLGLIGSTDSHTSLATADENNFWGKMASMEPGPRRFEAPVYDDPQTGIRVMNWDFAASGYAGVWARENTRASIFDALRRREVYATTGPRITLRFFGGWTFEPADAHRPDAVRLGYRRGIPMGGDLAGRPERGRPRFLVHALKDPLGAHLDRIQIVKGWLDAKGEPQERVYDVALGGRDRRDARGRPRSVGSTVDVEHATYLNTIGAAELGAFWEDPDFDPKLPAFWYVRVLEIPTPRWTTYDRVRLGAELPADLPRVVQDRAYSSPIWYSPD